MPDHAVELVFDAASDARIRADWQCLEELGVASCARHRGPTHAPHLSVVAAPQLDEHVERAAVAAFAGLLPLRVELDGLVVLGRRKLVLAHLLRPQAELVAAVQAVAATVPERRHHWWLPHVSVSTRLAPEQLGEAVSVLDARRGHDAALMLTGLRRWDPDTATVRRLL